MTHTVLNCIYYIITRLIVFFFLKNIFLKFYKVKNKMKQVDIVQAK